MQPLSVESIALQDTNVIEASAGTGKTYTITSLFLRLLLERELSVDQILVVTYTRAATAELRDRIGKRLAVALKCAQRPDDEDSFVHSLIERVAQRSSREQVVKRLERALADIDQAPVLTIHSFCQRVLRDHAFESGTGFGFELTAHAAPILDEIADDYFVAQLFDADPVRARLLCGEAETLRALAVRAGAFPSVRVIPEASIAPSLSLDDWQRAREECRKLWERDSQRIIELVSGLKGINKRYFPGWCEQMNELLTRGRPGTASASAGFAYFTRSAVREKAKGRPPDHAFFDATERLLAEDERIVAAMNHEKVLFRAGFVRYLHEQLEKRARDTEVRTFDALLGELAQALQSARAPELLHSLRRKYRAALVDEFQDTDPAQYAIFRRIFAEGRLPLFLIGDPKQAIYAFRGADVQAYLEARNDAGQRVFTLDVNRRSDEELVSALNTLYGSVQAPFLTREITYLPVSVPAEARGRFKPRDGSAPIDLAFVEGGGSEEATRKDIASRVAIDIGVLLSSGARRVQSEHGRRGERALAPSDIAVLCRTNREAHEVQLALSEHGVASVLSGDASVFDSEDAAHLERALIALAHPSDPRALRSFLSSIYGGKSAEELLSLEHDDEAWDEHARNFRDLSELFTSRGFTQALRALCERYRVEERLLARPDGLRRITNLQHLGELLSEANLTERLGPLGLLRWLETARSDAAARSELTTDSHELRLESGGDAVQLTTIHKSKGLEYPVVYCPFSYRASTLRSGEKELVRFHDPHADGALTLDLGSEDRKAHIAVAEQEAMAEALRLLYVALTRAKHRVCLVLPMQLPKTAAQSALIYTLLGGGDVDSIKARAEQLAGAAQFINELHERAKQSKGALSVRTLPARGSSAPLLSVAMRSENLEARPIRRSIDATSRTASFSALIAGRSMVHESFEPSDPDHDAKSETTSPLTLDSFPRGAAPGRLIHEVIEHAAFDASPAEWRESTQRILRARGYDESLLEVLVTALGEIVDTPLDERSLKLKQLSNRVRINELEFLFPVSSTLTSRSLAKAFRSQQAPAVAPTYPRRIEALPFEALRGFLRGFIDMVFQHEGRFYIVDYKSNYLGAQPADYGTDALLAAMSEHHYFLQYHLYALALHRHLTQRLTSYDYEQHFGGVYYLFLRGMAPTHPHQSGVFFDRPSSALIQALDRCMRAEETEQTGAA